MGTVLGATSETRVFGPTSTTEEVLAGVDLQGKKILVTGVSAGLGDETARSLAAHGAQVVGAARDLKKADALDPNNAEALWEKSEELVESPFSFPRQEDRND